MLFLKLLCAFGILLSLTSLTTSPPPAPPPVNPPAPSGPTPKPKNAKRGKNITTGAPIKVTIVDEELRLTNWCVTGKDEPEMQYFPYSEFQPYLARTSSSNRRLRDDYKKAKFDYSFRLDEIKFSDSDEDIRKASGGVGRGEPDYTPTGKMHNVAHLKFNAYKLRPYPLGVKEVRKPTKIEGLVIQMSHSPIGIGTATGQFMDPEQDIVCSDCIHAQGRPVGCRKRTRNDIVPPSIMVFHHQLPVLDSAKARINPRIKPVCKLCVEISPATTPKRYCRCNKFEYAPPGTTPPEYKECSSLPAEPTPFPECVGPDECYCYACMCNREDLPDGTTPPTPTPGSPPAPPPTAPANCRCTKKQPTTATVKYESCEDQQAKNILWLEVPETTTCSEMDASRTCACTGPPKNEPEKGCQPDPTTTPPGQCRCVGADLGLPEGTEECLTGTIPDCSQPAAGATGPGECRPRPAEQALDCVKENTANGCPDYEKLLAYEAIQRTTYLGPQDEVHGTLQWHFPPCLRSRAVEFSVLVVHSFAMQQFEVIFFGPFELPSLQSYPDMNQHVPSPFFHGYAKLYLCDDEAQATNIITDTDRSYRATYPFEYSYNYDKCIRESSRDDADGGQFCPLPDTFRCDEAEEKKYSVVFDRKCEKVCEVTTEAPPANETGVGRTAHGAINIITNFCIQPIAIFIGRYYKETLNRQTYKGMPLWYWVHLLGSSVASVAMYMGYFHPNWLPRTNSHVIAGNTIVVLLALTYVSSWIRHKNKWLRMSAEFFHGCCGYCCSFLAYWCLHSAPNVSMTSKILIYIATSCLGVGYIIMEGCIFYLDRKFGMKPRRRHFPTIEARFGDLPVAGANGRIAFLILLFVVMLVLTTITTFV